MINKKDKTSMELKLTQIAWVVKDLEKAKSFFQEMFGIENFSNTDITRLKEYDSTYYQGPSEGENFVTVGKSNGVYLEIIQPISGRSIFHDYIEKNPAGGLQHIAYSTSIENLDSVISDFENKGFPIVSRFDTSVAKIVFFDTCKEIGVFTEILGLNEKGKQLFP